MKTVLLDVNVLIALLWPTHEHHQAAHRWFGSRGGARWASCPLTQMAFVRIVSNPAFSPDALAPSEVVGYLERNLLHGGHEFWPDQLGLVEALGPSTGRLQGHRQLTDAYLLGLAAKRGQALRVVRPRAERAGREGASRRDRMGAGDREPAAGPLKVRLETWPFQRRTAAIVRRRFAGLVR